MTISYVSEQAWSSTDSSQPNSYAASPAISSPAFVFVPWVNGSTNGNAVASIAGTKSNSYVTGGVSNDAGSASYSCGFGWGQIVTALTTSDDLKPDFATSGFNYKLGGLLAFTGVATSSPQDGSAIIDRVA